ncbi:MAG: phospholipid-binding protein [Candidatus Pelagibacter sp. TMED64]|nr:MAG: phospholipid-binding protein [Candidatus Pelagibacter sp. TMED64]|tara:strand:+ start:776 stop:1375 length:600 start_codon:yes stop_codon:yes gene_type:complete
MNKINKKLFIIFIFITLSSCVGTSTVGVFGSGVSVALDPRTIGTQIDDSIMQKNLVSRLVLKDKKYFINVKIKVLDGRIYLTGKVDTPEEKLQITKSAWETNGARSVKNDIRIKEKFSFKMKAGDILITTQLRSAIILNKKISSANYNIDTYNKTIYIYGISYDNDERKEVIKEAKEILDVKDVVASILLVSDLSRQKD